jgi:hypothetical protein
VLSLGGERIESREMAPRFLSTTLSEIMNTSSADWPSGWLHPHPSLHPWGGPEGSRGYRKPSHRLPAPALIRLRSGAALPDALGARLGGQAPAQTMLRVDVILPPATSSPTSLDRFHNPSSTCCVPRPSNCASDLDLKIRDSCVPIPNSSPPLALAIAARQRRPG